MGARAPRSERGAALITVMLIVAVMSAVALAVMDDIRYSARRSANTDLRDQAMWYALGAERLAAVAIRADLRLDSERSRLASTAGRNLFFEIEGGSISGVLSDANNCFNLNALVEQSDAGRVASAVGVARYQRLLSALDFSAGEAAALAAAAVDWIDSDGSALGDGAEDAYYAGLETPHRAANAYVSEVEELRSVRGYSEPVYQRIRPYVCALPAPEPAPLNVNTLRPGQGPLLVMALGEGLTLDDAETLIAERPEPGYGSLDEFWTLKAVRRVQLAEGAQALVGVRTSYYGLEARVAHHGAEFALSSLLAAPAGGDVVVVTRKFSQAS